MAIVDSQGTTFSVDGFFVTNLVRYDFRDGVAAAVERRALNGQVVEAVQGMPVYGEVRLEVIYDAAADYATRLKDAYRNREIVTCVLTRTDSIAFSFPAFVRSLPFSGILSGTDTSTLLLHCSGDLTQV